MEVKKLWYRIENIKRKTKGMTTKDLDKLKSLVDLAREADLDFWRGLIIREVVPEETEKYYNEILK